MSTRGQRLDAAPPPPKERYAITRELGHGASGVVYLIHDHETGQPRALKKLLHMDAKRVLALKREFRSLQALRQPGLVELYDMGRSGDGWFITMDYVAGCDLLTYLGRAAPANSNAQPAPDVQLTAALFEQLAAALEALHRAAMLHGALKPSNVLVADGRLVVLDYGLAPDPSQRLLAYAAPDVVSSPASDWYAFGKLLSAALSGERVPAQLRALCSALLAREPAARPRYDDVHAALSPFVTTRRLFARADQAELSLPDAAHASRPLLGRTEELQALAQAFAEVARGRFVTVQVRGPSGVGKSALVEQFLTSLQLPAAQDALLLRARCYEREAMPFNALDGVLESLVSHLERLDEPLVRAMLPAQLAELTRAFPVLERLQVAPRESAVVTTAVQARQLAEVALRALLERVAAHTPLVIYIDDLHWADSDSLRVLDGLRAAAPARLLLIVSERSAHTPVMDRVLELQPLAADTIGALCREQLGRKAGERGPWVERIVQQARGNPLFACQLLALAEAKLAQGDSEPHALAIDPWLAQASALLPPPARGLLHVLAVAGRPLNLRLALGAAGIGRDGRSQLHALHSLGLTRARAVPGGPGLLELAHDAIREAVLVSLSEEQRRNHHRRLLAVLELSGQVNPDWLQLLAASAGERTSAYRYGLLAAERAMSTLAFERAVALYRGCLELSAADSGELQAKLAHALACCAPQSTRSPR